MTDPRVEAVARAIHAHNNSGVARSRDTLSWESEPPALQRWHLGMAEAALGAVDATRPKVATRIAAAWLAEFPDVMGDFEDSDTVDARKLAAWVAEVLGA